MLFFSFSVDAQEKARLKQNFDFDWKFILNDSLEANAARYDETKWSEVQLPHDWSINLSPDKKNGGSMGFMPGGVGWYRKSFEVPAAYRSKKVLIHFDGVYHQSDVYVNGVHLGFHPYGYTGFEYDLSPYLVYGGQNEIVVKVDHRESPSSRWYSGSGIYRHVWLKVLDPVHVSTWGTYITTPKITKESAEVKVVSTLNNTSSRKRKLTIHYRILDAKGKEMVASRAQKSIARKSHEDLEVKMTIPNPRFWDIDDPYQYTLETVVEYSGKKADQVKTRFGVREIEFDANKGFFLNGRPVKLKGMNLHADAGVLGTAVPERSNLRKLEILKEYGCNAIRCAHNPPNPEFLDMCDSLGFLVIDEVFDKWKTTGWFFGYYTKYFDQWWQKDVEAMVLRDRNHPSIIMWSVGNETSEQNDESGVGTKMAKMLQDYVHEIEPTRPVTVAISPGDLGNRPYHRNGFTEIFDVVGYNYSEPMLKEYKEAYPEAIMYVAEAFPYYNGRRNFVRDYAPDNPWYVAAENDFILGQFLWAGVDYLGESSGFPSTGWPTGLFDVCMFEKPRAAFHRSVWNDTPIVSIAVADQSLDIDPGKDHWTWPHLAAHWNFPHYRGHVIEVQTINNCDSVSLWVNEKWMGKRATSDYSNNTITWHVPYRKGVIRAVGFIGETEVAEFELQTSGKFHSIDLIADWQVIEADGQDLSHITVQLLDENRIPVPDDDQVIEVKVSGEGILKGLDNGDMRRTEPHRNDRVKTFGGKALIIVQSTREAGEIRLEVKVGTGKPRVLKLKSEN